MFGIGTGEMIFFGLIALLLFGKKLPEVARSLGKGITEFKKGMSGIEDEVHRPSPPQSRPYASDQRDEPAAPRFEPPKFEPVDTQSTQTHAK